MRRLLVVMMAVLLVAACGDAAPSKPRAEPEPSTPAPHRNERLKPRGLKAPPPVTVRYLDQAIDLQAWAYCYRNGCVDGAPPAKPLDVGDPEEIALEFPLARWSFQAWFSPAGDRCGREQRVPLRALGDGKFVLRPVGYAGPYDVTLEGRGNGDLFTTFRWTTPSEGPLPKPQARLAVISNGDGRPGSYGVELELTNLSTTPRRAAARITVQAGNGNEVTFRAKLARGGCFPEGTVYWDGPDEKGLAAARLGPRPFTYEVELVLDGQRFVAHAIWPDDEIKGNEPSVRLQFAPGLPALS